MNKKKAAWSAAIGVVIVLAGASALFMTQGKGTKQPIDQQALYSDGTSQFMAPMEPSKGQAFTVQLRAKKGNLSTAELIVGSKTLAMTKWQSDAMFDYFKAQVPGSDQPISYWFRVNNDQNKPVYYGRVGASSIEPDNTTAFWVYPGMKTPAWSQGAVLYQIFVDRFYNGDPSNDVVNNEYMYDGKPSVRVTDWSKTPDASPYGGGGNRTREFYGGDLQGVIDKLPYLKSLGVQGLYLNPVFVAPSNHKYDTQDYNHIDPHFGKIVKDGGQTVDPNADPATANAKATKYIERTTDPANLQASDDLFAKLVAEAHKQGIKIILDGVFNHTGEFNQWFDKEHIYPDTGPNGPGAYESEKSPFADYYTFSSGGWPNNDQYESWNGYNTLPKLNYEGSPELVKKIQAVGQKWVSAPYNADGWRLDAAGDVGHSHNYNLKFWAGFRQAVKQANPNALIFGEYYDTPTEYLMGDQWDSVMNYKGFLQPVSAFLDGMEMHSQNAQTDQKDDVQAFDTAMQQGMSDFPYDALFSAVNELDNHDISRFLTRTNGQTGDAENNGSQTADQGVNKGVLRQAAMLQFTWPGSPTIYYGDEAGVTGWTDPDDRRTYPWGHEDKQLVAYYQALGQLHHEQSALATGSFKTLLVSNEQKLYAYGRFGGQDKVATLFNVGDQAQTVKLPVWELGAQEGDVWKTALRSGDDKAYAANQQMNVANGEIAVTVPAHASVMLTSSQGVVAPKLP